jgi:hypothetical protein
LQILYQHRFPEPIWRLIPSVSKENSWAIETRSGTKKALSYYFLNCDYKLVELYTHLDWWSGIEALNSNIVLFHGYLQEDLPIHKGIKAFDAIKNEWLWENEFVAFDSVSDQQITAKSSIGFIAKNIYIDIKTGLEIESLNIQDQIPNSETATFLSSEETYFTEIASFISKYTPLLPTNCCEYLEKETHIIVSYYVSNEKKLDNYLLVTTIDGTEELHICISEGIKGVAAGTFLVSKGLLSFVKDNYELFIVEMQ